LIQLTAHHSFATTLFPTPVFNTPEIASCFGGETGDTLLLDDQGMMRSVETILFTGTLIKLLEKMKQPHIWRIETKEYPYNIEQFIDERFITRVDSLPSERTIKLPSAALILKTLQDLEKTRYIWGGNWPHGIDLLPNIYPSKSCLHKLDPLVNDTWSLRGVDCSGLLHYATNGLTPRNTSALVNFGKPVDIEGDSLPSILEKLQPLDLIVWRGHVVCAINKDATIESKQPEGVIQFSAHDRLSEIMNERRPANCYNSSEGPTFVVRRWHPDYLFS
jgi:hypothetical protein